MTVLTATFLDEYHGKSMADICPNGYDNIAHNHCAHFVAHALGYDFSRTCDRMVRRSNRLGRRATRSVKEIFNRSFGKHIVDHCTPLLRPSLVFVTMASNLRTRTGEMSLRSSMTRHIGIGLGRVVWHYSNPNDRVARCDLAQFVCHYGGRTVMVVGDLVPGTAPIPYGQCIVVPAESTM